MQNFAINSLLSARNIADELEIGLPQNFITRQPPSYVTILLENVKSGQIEPPDPEIDGIMVYSINEENEKTRKLNPE